ncbi:hypothetical protein H6P81_015608 [Aristolochia fimbriata]|uniref:Uncharacterized protein n=1 Tax=Aristolochia fimbriata TaxID=158543 RepID=A0AAV7E6I3_ARIFI|nr:hypothetical protein H6P81_015608 [Aristolochia fimbriata]
MWPRMRALSSFRKGGQYQKSTSLNVNEEYLSVLRTDSYADYFTKAQSLAQHPSPASYAHLSQSLLEPGQDTVAALLDSPVFSKNSVAAPLRDYFDVSADASRICTALLDRLRRTRANHRFIRNALDLVKQAHSSGSSAMAELGSFNRSKNPFSTRNEFDAIRVRYSAMLAHLKRKKKKVVRKILLLKCLNRGSKIALTAACGALATLVAVLAVHTLSGLVLGPALFGFSPPLGGLIKKKVKALSKLGLLRTGLRLRRAREELDAAAKGTYILNRDFDTMSRLVERLRDEIEHRKAMIRFCLERREDRFALMEVVKELGKTDEAFMEQVEELEEHVYLCLVTINRARVLVTKEITLSQGGKVAAVR